MFDALITVLAEPQTPHNLEPYK